MATKLSPLGKRPCSEHPLAGDAPPAKRCKIPTLHFENASAAQVWIESLPKARPNILYFGKVEETPTLETLQGRMGIGKPSEITEYAERVFEKWVAFGTQQLNKSLANFFKVTSEKLISEAARCLVDYGEFRLSIKDGWLFVKDESGDIVKAGCLQKEVLTKQDQTLVEKLIKTIKVEVSSIGRILDEKERGLRAQLSRLHKVMLTWNASLHKFKVAVSDFADPKLFSIRFYDFFRDKNIIYVKKETEQDKGAFEAFQAFCRDYSLIVLLFEAYLKRFIVSAEYARQFYAKGIESLSVRSS